MLIFKVENFESKIYDDIQKIIDFALNKDELTQDLKKSVNYFHKKICKNKDFFDIFYRLIT